MTFAKYPDVPLAGARERHAEARRVMATGADPMAQRMAERTAAEDSFQSVASLWLENWQDGKSPRHVGYTKRRMEADILPCLGARPIDAIEAPELVGMTKAIEQHVADIWDCHKKWGAKGAFFLTGPLPDPDGWEWRCHMRDPDGYIIEVGQYTQLAIDWFNSLS